VLINLFGVGVIMETKQNKSCKYVYWFDEQGALQIKKELQEKGVEPVQAKQNPCEALRGEVGYAEPHVWNIICKHDAAPWYHASKHTEKYLVVSSSPLPEKYACFLETTIEPTAFQPPAMTDLETLAALARDSTYVAREPDGWGKFPREMGEAIVQGLTKMTGTPPATDFPELLQTWTAVHANFVNPRYRAGAEYMNAPYSISDTVHISSCCVELFNLLNSNEETLLVRPCIGSVIIKVLEKDRHYRVTLCGTGKSSIKNASP
jgi:hypothetical protein